MAYFSRANGITVLETVNKFKKLTFLGIDPKNIQEGKMIYKTTKFYSN